MKRPIHTPIGKTLLLLLFCSIIFSKSYSQGLLFGDNDKTKWEAGLNFGPSFFLGDLGGNAGKGTRFLKDVNLKLTKLMKGAYISMYPKKWVGLRIAADYTYLEGDDAIIKTNGIDEIHRKQRNLDFKSNVWEVYGALELFPTMFFSKEDYDPMFRPYALIGLGLFHFNPQGSLKDAAGNKTWYYLHPLKTEGQGMAEYAYNKPYKLTQMNIPLGAGIKCVASERLVISMELLYRKTFTDYIDDVSKNYIDPKYFSKYLSAKDAAIAYQISDKLTPIIFPGMTRMIPGMERGDKTEGDTYFSIIAKIGFRLGQVYENSAKRRAVRQTRCPTVY